ncbi:MAG: hypothetical protein NTX48_03355 [Planctomycetales bacterium]|nr:hypothetical protein [Planctomycetales bacterium]
MAKKKPSAAETAESDSDNRMQCRLAEWRVTLAPVAKLIAGSERISADDVRVLRRAYSEDHNRMRQYDDDFATSTCNLMMRHSRTLKAMIQKAAAFVGMRAAPLFEEDRQRRSDAWGDFIAAVQVYVAPARKKKPSTNAWSQEDETEGRRILKADAKMSSNDFAKKIGGNRQMVLLGI